MSDTTRIESVNVDAQPPLGNGQRPAWTYGQITLGVLFALELVAAAIVNWPVARNFVFLAFQDSGGSLNVERMLELGFRPGVDFYYAYGLLPLLVGRAWFGVLGLSTLAYVALTTLCCAVIGLGMARCARALRASLSGVFVVAVSAPLVVPDAFFNITHALEMALLVHALAEHALGRRNVALALATTSAFVKPSMAYAYVFVLSLLILRDLLQKRSTSVSRWSREFGPALGVAVFFATVLGGMYGLSALLAVQVPLASHRSYELVRYGFFNGVGRDFWWPRGARLGFYVGTFAGVWLIMTVILIIGVTLTLCQAALKRVWLTQSAEFGLTVAVLHVSFVCLFFGNSASWIYYAFILIPGVIAVLNPLQRPRQLLYPLATMFLILDARSIANKIRTWRSLSPSEETVGLWATQSQRKEWRQVLKLTSNQKALMIKPLGCAEMLFPSFHGTDSWLTASVLIPLLPDLERRRIHARIDSASTVVVTTEARDIVASSEFSGSFKNFFRIWHGDLFDVYRRTGDLE